MQCQLHSHHSIACKSAIGLQLECRWNGIFHNQKEKLLKWNDQEADERWDEEKKCTTFSIIWTMKIANSTIKLETRLLFYVHYISLSHWMFAWYGCLVRLLCVCVSAIFGIWTVLAVIVLNIMRRIFYIWHIGVVWMVVGRWNRIKTTVDPEYMNLNSFSSLLCNFFTNELKSIQFGWTDPRFSVVDFICDSE